MSLWDALEAVIQRDLDRYGIAGNDVETLKQGLKKLDKQTARRILYYLTYVKGLAQSATEPELLKMLESAVDAEAIIQQIESGSRNVYYGQLGESRDDTLWGSFYFFKTETQTWIWVYNDFDPGAATEAWVVVAPDPINFIPPLGQVGR